MKRGRKIRFEERYEKKRIEIESGSYCKCSEGTTQR
jgi:hypothetical protein